MKIGVILPMSEVDIPRAGMPSWDDAKAFAQHAEAAGLDSVWVFDTSTTSGRPGPSKDNTKGGRRWSRRRR